MATVDDLIASFLKSDAHHQTLLGALDVESLLLSAHVHEVRLKWLEVGGGINHLELIEPLAPGDEESRDTLRAALDASARATADFVRELHEEEARVKGFGGTLVDFVAYLIAHDAHHRGQILALLAREKKSVPPEIAYGIWDWCG